MKSHQTIFHRLGRLAAVAASAILLGVAALPDRAGTINWNGQDANSPAVGNFSYCDNWYGANCPTAFSGWVSGNDLHFSYNQAPGGGNGSETNIVDDYGASPGWVSIGSIYWDSTFYSSIGAINFRSANGYGINFGQKVENDWAGNITISCPLSGGHSATNIQLNPVAGNLTISNAVYNDTSFEYQVWGGTANNIGSAHKLILQYDLVGGVTGRSAVDMNIEDDGSHYGIVDVQAAQTWGGSTNIYINAGELWIDTGGSLAAGQTVTVGDGSGVTPAKLWLSPLSGGINFTNAITTYQSGTVERTIGGLNTSGTDTYYSPITLNGQINLSAATGGTVTFAGPISGSGQNVVVNGFQLPFSGMIVMSATNTYSGSTFISGGTLQFNANGFASNSPNFYLGETLGSQTATLALGATGGGQNFTNAIIVRSGSSGTKTIKSLATSGSDTLSGGISLSDNLVFNSAGGGNLILSGPISGGFGLTNIGPGTVTLASSQTNNTFSGGLTVGAGIVATSHGADLKNAPGLVTVGAGGSFDANQGFDGNNFTNAFNLSGTGSGGSYGALNGHGNAYLTGPVTLNADTKITHDFNYLYLNGPITVAGAGKNLTLYSSAGSGQGTISVGGTMNLGTGVLTVDGSSGDLGVALNAANTYSGGTVITNYGLLQLGNTSALGSGGLTMNGGTLDLNTRNVSIPSLSGTTGAITDRGAAGTTTLTVNQSVTTTYSGIITNGATRTVALTLSGAGALSLAGTNTYTGATAVNAGELIGVTGGSCSNSAITVASGATNGVKLAAVGGQWACSNLTYNSGTTYADFNFSGLTPSTAVAPLLVNGNLAFTGIPNVLIRNFYWSATGTYPLVSYTGTLSGTPPSTVANLPAGVTATLFNNTGAKRIDLSITAVSSAPSSTGTWTNLVSGNAGGVWGTAVNWNPNTVPNGTDVAADISTLNITVNSTITNETVRTVGTLKLGTTGASGKTLAVDGSTNNQLTLATSTGIVPSVNVTANMQGLLGGINGTLGLAKNGSGSLAIYGKNYTNNVTGPIYVNGGLLGTVNGQAFQNITGDITVAAGASFEANANGGSTFSNNIYLSGTGGTPSGYVGNASTPDGTYSGEPTPFGALDIHGTTSGSSSVSGTITLNTDSLITHGYNIAYITGPVVATGAGKNLQLSVTTSGQYPIYVNGSMSLGTGALTVNSVSGGGNGSADNCAVVLNASNNFTGGTVLTNYGSLKLGSSGALGSGGLTVNGGFLDLNTKNISLPFLSGTNGAITDRGAAGTTTLTVNQTVATMYSGVITNGVTRTVALTLSGAGALSLAGVNTYNGATAVNVGELVGVTGGSCSNSAITVAAGATNGVQIATAGGQWACGSLTYSSGTTYLDINFASAPPSTTIAPLLVNGNLTNNGTLNIIVRSSLGVTNGVYPLVKYTGGTNGSLPSTAFSLPTGWGGSLSNDVANSSLDLVVTNGTVLQWAVGNGAWDTNTTANWKDPNGTSEKYFDGDTVTFDDTASGTSPITVTNNSAVTPGSVTINNTNKAYVLTGNGGVTGATSLVKKGSAGSTLTLGGTNTYAGGTINSGGTLKLGSDQALGTGSVTVQSGAGNPTVWLDLNGHTVTNTIANTGGDCYIRNSSATAATFAGPVAIGSYTRLGYYGDTIYGSVGSITISGTLSGLWSEKQGVSLLVLAGTNTYTGSTRINGGVVRAVDGAGITTNNLILNDAYSVGAVFESAGGSNIVRALGAGANQVQLTNNSCGFSAFGAPVTVSLGGLGTPAPLVWGSAYFSPTNLVLNYYSANTYLTLANAINLNGASHSISVYANTATAAGVISNSTGTAGLTKAGVGTLVLTNVNPYNGGTTISAGTLALSGSGSIASTPFISLASGATFDVSGLSSPFVLGGGQTLSNSASGTGILNGNLNTSSGTVSVSFINGTPSFIITNGTLTLWPGTAFQINNTGSALGVGSYQIISNATAGIVGSVAGTVPASVTVNGGSIVAGTIASLQTNSAGLNLVVAKGNQMIGFTNGPTVTKTYGNPVFADGATNSSGLTLSYASDNTGVATVDAGGNVTIVATGSCHIVATNSGSAGYNPASASQTLTVNPLPVGLAGTRAYDGTTNAAYGILSVTNKVGTDTVMVASGSAGLAGKNAGTQAITSFGNLNLGNNAAGNYTLAGASGSVTITQASSYLAVASSSPTNGYHDSVYFIATVQANAATAADASSFVVFATTNGTFSTNTLVLGTTNSLSLTNLPRGTNVIIIGYVGDSNYLGYTNTLAQIVTNRPPMATAMTVIRTGGLDLMIAIADVRTNFSDADGDTVTLTGFNLVTSNGVNLATNNDYIYYTNSPNVNDQISYSISDGQGGTNIGFVNIVVTNSVTGTNSITALTYGTSSNTITAYGIPSYYYILERATNLISPVWVDVQTNQAATNGVINAADTFWDLGGVAPSPSAFYQLKWQP